MRAFLISLILFLASTASFADDKASVPEGMIVVPSEYDVSATMDKLEGVLKQKGLTIFKRINHAEGAASVNMTLRPTELLIFGNPRGGTPLMAAAQTMAIDLPLKAIAYRTDAGDTYLAYNDIEWLADRHGVSSDHRAVQNIKKALANFAKAATE